MLALMNRAWHYVALLAAASMRLASATASAQSVSAEKPSPYCRSFQSLTMHKHCEPTRCGLDLCQKAFLLDLEAEGLRYTGHGALSAGGLSRLFHDYPIPQRNEILDYLFLPKFGAALHMLKVEIGGDSQSGFGTEPSHMHLPGDLSCKRGHQFWLMKEARLRNPRIVLYALAWAMPHWVGVRNGSQHGFHETDSIRYLVEWISCAHKLGVGNIDYLGNRNERNWGPPQWTISLRAALDTEGFSSTKLMLPDGQYDPQVVELAQSNVMFMHALQGGGMAVHYPCYLPGWEVRRAGFKFLSSEDGGGSAGWAGAQCWGRKLNQNFVRMNITGTVARALVLAAYFPAWHTHDALLVAAEPWSGRFSVLNSLWVTAHTTQFTEVGWWLLPTSRGSGQLSRGGSFVAYVSPARNHFTLVVEKLHGSCPSCSGQTTGRETVLFKIPWHLLANLANSSDGSHLNISSTNKSIEQNETVLPEEVQLAPNSLFNLSHWLTNSSHTFVRLPDLHLDYATGSFGFVVEPDTIYTVSTTRGQLCSSYQSPFNASDSTRNSTSIPGAVKGNSTLCFGTEPQVIDPQQQGFPLPLADDFDGYWVDTSPRFFSDYSGSWQVAPDPARGGSNRVLKQWVEQQAGVNQWLADANPMSLVGGVLTNSMVSAEVYLPHDGKAVSMADITWSNMRRSSILQSVWSSLCLGVLDKVAWGAAPLIQQTCSSDRSDQFIFDIHTGFIIVRRTNLCITVFDCQLGSQVDVCQASCTRSSQSRSTQSWTWEEDGTLRLRVDPSLCLTATNLQPGPSIRLLPCEQSSARQRWLMPGSPLVQYVGLCLRMASLNIMATKGRQALEGYCLNVGRDVSDRGRWQLLRSETTLLAWGSITNPVGSWHKLSLAAQGPQLVATVDDEKDTVVVDTGLVRGMTALQSSWGTAYIDTFEMHAM